MNLCNPHPCSGFQFGFRSVTPIQDLTVRNYILGNPPAGSWDLQVTLEVFHCGPVRVLFGSSAGPVRVLVGSCSGLFQILVRSCSNPIEVLSWIPSQIYKTIRYSLYSSSAWGYLKPSLICVQFLYNYLQNLSLSMEPHHIVLSNVTGLPPILPGSHMTIRLYHRHLSSVDVSDL